MTDLPTTAQAVSAYYRELRELGVPREVAQDLARDLGSEMHTGSAELRLDNRVLAQVMAERELRRD
ncbi:hypothetical protein AGRA3207_000184 [Actinomadura graeca]|uniref:Uncharacterized protein n=1 Tax=Actinomadura graeca TaxID=2750812 RepID=A0ABX8QM07_9ACTN|nr:hypothetical protein [Actinomadura graeca]QXJ19622.1 hypothetical protein AGRA3207_000184 [Actinomadura graeca]